MWMLDKHIFGDWIGLYWVTVLGNRIGYWTTVCSTAYWIFTMVLNFT